MNKRSKAGVFIENGARVAAGFTLVEVLVTTAIASLLLLALGSAVANMLEVGEDSKARNALARDAHFAMERMTLSLRAAPQLLVPMVEDPGTGNSESLIDPGALAVVMDPNLDRDLDGVADADNDGDGLVNEDLGRDATNNGTPGLPGIDDNNSGITDVSLAGDRDDDETGIVGDEDPINGIDDDGDASIDEDPPADMNGDGAPGVVGLDDDGDSAVDEGDVDDDDEDGAIDEDWLDAVAYFLVGTDLIERYPNLNPVDGNDYTERIVAENVTTFRVERLPRGPNRADLVEITLTVGTGDASILVQQMVRVGGSP